jgi:hypothetical protein
VFAVGVVGGAVELSWVVMLVMERTYVRVQVDSKQRVIHFRHTPQPETVGGVWRADAGSRADGGCPLDERCTIRLVEETDTVVKVCPRWST